MKTERKSQHCPDYKKFIKKNERVGGDQKLSFRLYFRELNRITRTTAILKQKLKPFQKSPAHKGKSAQTEAGQT